MKKFYFIMFSVFTVLSLVFLSCSKDSTDDLSALDKRIMNLPPMTMPAESPPTEISSDAATNDGAYTCTVKYYKAAPGFTQMTMLDPTVTVIYPGALIKGESIATGAYTPIVESRGPLTISASLTGVVGSVSRTINKPNLSTVRDAINEILSQEVTQSVPANMSFTVEDVYSSSQLSLALGANFSNATVDVSGSFNFDNTNIRSRVVAKFVQKYYSIDIDIPSKPSDFFSGDVDVSNLGAVSPMYVANVTYGRLALFAVESSYSSSEIKAALDAAYSAAINASVSLSTEYQNIMNSSIIKAYIVGGSGTDAVGSIAGYEGFKEYILKGGEYSSTSTGAPISYQLRFLSNNEIGKIVISSEYTVRDCDLNPLAATKTISITLTDIYSNNDCDWSDYSIDLYGYVAWASFDYFWYTTDPGTANAFSHFPVNKTLTKVYTAPFSGTITLATDFYDYDASSANDYIGGAQSYIDVSTVQTNAFSLFTQGAGCQIQCLFNVVVY